MTPRRPRLRPALLTAALLLVFSPTGCSGGKKLYPVEGMIVYEDGKPAVELAGGTVSFESVEDRSNASGQIRPDGTFGVRTPLGQDGAPAGTYRVLVQPPEG